MSVSGSIGVMTTRAKDRLHALTPATRSGAQRFAIFVVVALAVPLVISAAWVPIRGRLPNVDLALILVIAVAGIGTLGRRSGVVLGAISAALWFEFFDTAPFERLGIARNPDIETTLVLAVAAVVVGELAVRVTRHRRYAEDESEKLSSMRSVAELVASGEELVTVIGSVATGLIRLLDLTACTFESTESDPARPVLNRDGDLVRSKQPTAVAPAGEPLRAELPVIVLGEPIGHFVLDFDVRHPPRRDRVLVAMTLADNVGAAFLAQAPPPVPPDRHPSLPLRLLARGEASSASAASGARSHETSGRARAVGAASNS
jgi:hypothetical protein